MSARIRWEKLPALRVCSGRDEASTLALSLQDLEPMTSRGAGGDLAETVGNLCPWRHRGRRYRSAVVPALNECLFILCARYRLHSREAGCAPADQQLDRHEDCWNLVLAERLLHWDLAMLRLGPVSLGQRGECRSGHAALPQRQLTPYTCPTTSGACQRASVAATKPDSHGSHSGWKGALVPPGWIVAPNAATLHSRQHAAPTPQLRPNGYRIILHFHLSAIGPSEESISLGIVNSLLASTVLEESLREFWSAR